MGERSTDISKTYWGNSLSQCDWGSQHLALSSMGKEQVSIELHSFAICMYVCGKYW